MAEKEVAINILCSQHGMFAVGVKNHLEGEGCPQCDNVNWYLAEIDGHINKVSKETIALLGRVRS